MFCLVRRSKDGGRVGAVQVDRLIGGEQQNPVIAEFAFQFQRVEGVPAAAFDVFADDGGEPGGRGAGFGQQVSQAPVAGQAPVHERLMVARAAALLEVQAAGFDVPVVGGQVEPVGEPFPGGSDLPGDGPVGVLEFQGGGAAQHRHRHRLGRPYRPGSCFRSYRHCRILLTTSAWRASRTWAFRPVSTRHFHRAIIPAGLSSSSRL
jgi:hypothetical protein